MQCIVTELQLGFADSRNLNGEHESVNTSNKPVAKGVAVGGWGGVGFMTALKWLFGRGLKI